MANAGEHSNAGILIIGLRFPAEGSYNSYSKSSPMTFPITPKNLIGLSAILLMLAVVFGVLNTQKLKSFRTSAFNAATSGDNSEHRHSAQEKESKAREASLTAKFSEMEGKTAKTEAELVRIQADKANLQSKLQVNEGQIAALHRQIDEASAKPSANPGAPSTIELQAQLEETRSQLEVAENAEMLVVRGGTLIGKIRVSSVEPFTAIGDIITSSLTRGVQVHPGDTVIYAGNF